MGRGTEHNERVERFEKWADELDLEVVDAVDVSDLREVAEAADAVSVSEALLADAVSAARAHGRSWGHIGFALGMSRQGARQRFARIVDADR